MANNFKSDEQTRTAGGFPTLVNCTTTSVIVSSVLIAVADVGSADYPVFEMELFFKKSGSSPRSLRLFKGTGLPKGSTTEVLEKNVILENGDQLLMNFGTITGGGSVTVITNYMEKTADVATSEVSDLSDVSSVDPDNGQVLVYNSSSGNYEPTTLGDVADIGDTGDLPEQTTGFEPRNRYMKNFGSLSQLQNTGNTETATEVLKNSPEDVVFVGCNSGYTGLEGVPFSFTFENIIQALLQGALEEISADPGNGVDIATLTGTGGIGDLDDDGAVSTADLLDFLVNFGQNWSLGNSSLFQPTKLKFVDGTTTLVDGNLTVLGFDSNDSVGPLAGTQDVTVDGSNNLVKIDKSSAAYPLHVLLDKHLLVGARGNHGILQVTTQVAGETLELLARVKIYDEANVQLGNTIEEAIYSQTFNEAVTDFLVATESHALITNTTVEDITGYSLGWKNSNFRYLTVQIVAKTRNGTNAYVSLDGTFRIELYNSAP